MTAQEALKLEIVTPKATIYTGYVTSVKAPGKTGYFQILNNHTSYLASIKIGEIDVISESGPKRFATSGGYVEVFNNVVSVMAETAEDADNIDRARALEAKERAEQRLSEKDEGIDFLRAKRALFKAINRIKVIEKK